MKKIRKKIGKIIGMFFVVILALILLLTVTNQILIAIERNKYSPYGEKVKVGSEYMNVVIKGDAEQTIVLLPGYSVPAPGLEYLSLAESLAQDYRVVVIEPFGYGYSDITKKERTIKNITDEIHDCLQSLGIDQYILMAHSISGIYSQYFVQQYRDEITAFVGIDTSVPEQNDSLSLRGSYRDRILAFTGIYRVILNLNPSIYFPSADKASFSDEVMAHYFYLVYSVMGNSSVVDEGNQALYNFQAVRDTKFPADLPVLLILADESIKMMADFSGNWVGMHQELITESQYSRIEILEGSHVLYRIRAEDIKNLMEDFLGSTNQKNDTK